MADLQLQRAIYQCPCSECLNAPSDETSRDHAAINRVIAALDERQRRLFAGLLALRCGRGGIAALAKITGLSRMTIRRGLRELRSGVGPNQDRVRQPGGGRPPIEKKRLRP
jgi:DNA-binding phage protein